MKVFLFNIADYLLPAGLEGGYAAIAIPYPATKYWDYAKTKGLVSNDMDFGKLETIADFKTIRKKDFILLSDIDRDKFIEYGLKIQKIMNWATIKSYFNLKKISWKIIKLMLMEQWRKYENLLFSR